MSTAELRKKVIACANKTDEKTLQIAYAVFENYEGAKEYDLPEVAERLTLQAMEESEEGLIRPHDEVKAEFKKNCLSK
jgi:DNA-directed RNA polymerase subunit K/omega